MLESSKILKLPDIPLKSLAFFKRFPYFFAIRKTFFSYTSPTPKIQKFCWEINFEIGHLYLPL